MTDNNVLENFSDDVLEKELARREAIKIMPVPKEMNTFDPHMMLVLKEMAVHYVEGLAKNGYEPKDIEHYIFEKVMEMVYGKDVWFFVNNILK